MEDCTVTTEIIGDVHHTYYSRDGVIIAECRKNEIGKIKEERWYHDNKLHREDGPAAIEYSKNGLKKAEWWYLHNKHHRIDGPSIICYKNGKMSEEYWYRDGRLHREDGPAVICFENGIMVKKWYRNDKLCPIGVLASVIFDKTDPTGMYWDKDEHRDLVKGDAIYGALRPLPIPIRDAITWHYCYQ